MTVRRASSTVTAEQRPGYAGARTDVLALVVARQIIDQLEAAVEHPEQVGLAGAPPPRLARAGQRRLAEEAAAHDGARDQVR
ncbi:MAG: hypothetical protein Q4D79_05565 [Propionibacteriaceae bacterium]|nr:hypothetical protein [Propionibacteriaceae bacterium]